MKKECSENEVRNKAEAYCSSVERCGFEMEEILRCVKQVDADVEYLG